MDFREIWHNRGPNFTSIGPYLRFPVGMYRIVNFIIWPEPDSTKVASQA